MTGKKRRVTLEDKKLKYAMTGDKKTRITQPRKWWERLIEILTGSYDG